MLQFSIITLFPDMFTPFTQEGVIARAVQKELIKISPIDLRTFATGERRNVDARPAGGGDGMVIRADVTQKAILSQTLPNSYIIHLSPSGVPFTHELARKLSKKEHIILLSGRYSGFDERVIQKYTHLNLSLGDFVLSGGELPALCVIDAVSRFIPGVLGNEQSAEQDSFENGLLEAPLYTKPLHFEGMDIPEVLLSGNHAQIKKFQRREQIKRTAQFRPDLLKKSWDKLTDEEKNFVNNLHSEK